MKRVGKALLKVLGKSFATTDILTCPHCGQSRQAVFENRRDSDYDREAGFEILAVTCYHCRKEFFLRYKFVKMFVEDV